MVADHTGMLQYRHTSNVVLLILALNENVDVVSEGNEGFCV